MSSSEAKQLRHKSFEHMAIQYAIGFTLALLLTVATYGLVIEQWFNLSVGAIAATVLGLAALQVVVQVVFFLHLGSEKGPRWKTVTFGFTALMMLVIVIGSLWVMYNLDYRMGMSPDEMQKIMLIENDKGF